MEANAATTELFLRLGLALALGMLIGFERGWHEREGAEGSRVAGIRTFALIGLLGGVWQLLAADLGPVMLGAAFLAFAAVVIVARVRASASSHDYGLTTVVAALLTFALGALAAQGELALAAAAAVITTTLLGTKPILHGWLVRISYDELLAMLKLLVMSVVLLPVLPDRGYGPWAALNPYELWLMVVLIAGISFFGYAAVRIAGERSGILLAGIAGGLVSSTAVTLNLSRLARRNPARRWLLAAGIGFAATTMFPRSLLVIWAIAPPLGGELCLPLAVAALAGYLAAFLLWHRCRTDETDTELALQNPFELSMALQFGLLLAAVLLAAHGLRAWLGHYGLYLLAAASGLADVDAINLSLARMVDDGLAVEVAAGAVVLAIVANTLVKAGMAVAIGGRAMLLPVVPALGASLAGLALGYAVRHV